MFCPPTTHTSVVGFRLSRQFDKELLLKCHRTLITSMTLSHSIRWILKVNSLILIWRRCIYLGVSALCSRCVSNDQLEAAVRVCPCSIKEACWLVRLLTVLLLNMQICLLAVRLQHFGITSRCTCEDKVLVFLSPSPGRVWDTWKDFTRDPHSFFSSRSPFQRRSETVADKRPKGAESSRGRSDWCAAPLTATAGSGRGQGWGAKGARPP